MILPPSSSSLLDALPNAITCARIALVPVVALVILASPENWVLGAAVFAVAAISDALDGRIARARGCVSTFGTMMDPVADKLLIGAALISLAYVGHAAAWVAVAVIARELAVSALRLHAGRRGVLIAASPLGKAKMALQVGMVIVLMAAGMDPAWVQAIVYATVGFTIASGFDYFAAYRRGELAPAPAPVAPRGSSQQIVR
jgi:CDP-diacylglycerol--glycerol-3-phosphate 3-phosphatidyltransferase